MSTRDLRDRSHSEPEDPTTNPERPAARPEIERQSSAGGAENKQEGSTSPASHPANTKDHPAEG
jgi:hypothetical protein